MSYIKTQITALVTAIALIFATGVFAEANQVTTDASLPLVGRSIILDAGHKSGQNMYKGYDEGVYMLILAQKIQPFLEAQGARVLMTRSDDTSVSLSDRATLSNLWSMEALLADAILQDNLTLAEEVTGLIGLLNALLTDSSLLPSYYNYPYSSRVTAPQSDMARIFELQGDPVVTREFLFISLHSNATGTPINEERHGADVYFADPATAYHSGHTNSQLSQLFGSFILDEIGQIGIEPNKVQGSNFLVNREMNLPSVLVENGFHTNDHDRALLSDDDFLDHLAEGYVNAIINYFSSDLVPDVPVTEPELDLSNSIQGFHDLHLDAWYADAVTYALDDGLFNGMTSTTFEPDTGLTRAMFTTVLMRMAKQSNPSDSSYYNPYSDLTPSDWYYNAAVWGNFNGIFSGTTLELDVFQGNALLTREEALVLLWNTLNYLGYQPSITSTTAYSFADFSEMNSNFVPALGAMADLGIVRGDENGYFNPKNPLTRAECCQLLFNLSTIL